MIGLISSILEASSRLLKWSYAVVLSIELKYMIVQCQWLVKLVMLARACSKLVKDSIISMQQDDQLCAGQVSAFVTCASMLCGGQEDRASYCLRYVHWYAWFPEDQPFTEPVLGCSSLA